MNNRKVALAVWTLASLVGAAQGLAAEHEPSMGHEASSVLQLVKQTRTLDGMVVRVTFTEPHALVYVMVTDTHGNEVTWEAEWRGARALREEHIDRNTLAVGDHVIVTGNLAQDGTQHRLRLDAIDRPADGWMWVAANVDH